MGCTGSSQRRRISTKLTPRQISLLKRQTKFTEEEIQEWHADFLRECPEGHLNQQKLLQMCQKFYPHGDVNIFSKRIFTVMDGNEDGIVDFVEYLLHMDILLQGNIDERLGLAFQMYDKSQDGQIDEEELALMISVTDNLKGRNRRPNQAESKRKAAEIMNQLDVDHDGKLNKREFISGCKTNTGIRHILAPGVESTIDVTPLADKEYF